MFTIVNYSQKQAWIAIICFISFVSCFLVLGSGKLLILPFPIGALALGLFLYFRYPTLYIGFTLWTWFLSPFVRRLIDYQSGYLTPGPWTLAPLIVSSIALITFLRELPRYSKQGGFPFILSFGSIFYAFLIGLIQRGVSDNSIIVLLKWLDPLLFSFHLFVSWHNYPNYRKTLERTFLWGVLIMGVYGIIQFLVAPAWDQFFLIQGDLGSGGKPEPLKINVWSTMQANRPFGTTMVAGLLVLFVNKNKEKIGIPTTIAGYLSFLLARKRTTWMSFALGLMMLVSLLKPKQQIRIFISITLILLLIIPIINTEQFSEFIVSRFETLSDLESDNSRNARQETYQELLGSALTTFIGKGLGGPSYDSAIISTLFDLGWLGTIFYMSGLILLLVSIFMGLENQFDPFVAAARSIAFVTFIQIPLGVPFVDIQGIILWGFLGIAMAAKKYYSHKRLDATKDTAFATDSLQLIE